MPTILYREAELVAVRCVASSAHDKKFLGARFRHLHMKMGLSMRLGILDPLFQDLLGLLSELAVQIDGVGLDAPVGVVLAEDELGRLFVVLLHLAAVGLALLGELLGAGAIAARVGFLRLVGGC